MTTLERVGKGQDFGDGFEERIKEIDRGLKMFDKVESLKPDIEKVRILGEHISSEHATKNLVSGQRRQAEKVTTHRVQGGTWARS